MTAEGAGMTVKEGGDDRRGRGMTATVWNDATARRAGMTARRAG